MTPTPGELWIQAGEDGAEYRRLLREHGLLAEGPAEQSLPCGWTPGGASTTDTPGPGHFEEPHHRAARQPTDEERAAARRATLDAMRAGLPGLQAKAAKISARNRGGE